MWLHLSDAFRLQNTHWWKLSYKFWL